MKPLRHPFSSLSHAFFPKYILDKIKLVQDLTACSDYCAPVIVESGLRCVAGIGDQDLSLWCKTFDGYCKSAKERKKPDEIHYYRERANEGYGNQVIAVDRRSDIKRRNICRLTYRRPRLVCANDLIKQSPLPTSQQLSLFHRFIAYSLSVQHICNLLHRRLNDLANALFSKSIQRSIPR